MAHDRTVVGIDFGTTNSSVALANGDSAVRLVPFASSAGTTEAFRSLIKSWTEPAGIEPYLAAETKGRLVQSLKSHLSSRTLTSTDVFRQRRGIETLIAKILPDLRVQAERHFGRPIRHRWSGGRLVTPLRSRTTTTR